MVSSAAIFGGEQLNKNSILSTEQIQVAISTLESNKLGSPSQLTEAFNNNLNEPTVKQISAARAKLISTNPEVSKAISDDLMEKFNSNPNTDNLVALFQSLGEQNPKLKPKFDMAIKELGQDPDSKPIDLKEVAAFIASISGGLLVLKGAKSIKDSIIESKKPAIKSDEVIPNDVQKLQEIEDFKPVIFSTKSIEDMVGNKEEIQKAFESRSLAKKEIKAILEQIKQLAETETDPKKFEKIKYIGIFVRELYTYLKELKTSDEIQKLSIVAKAAAKIINDPTKMSRSLDQINTYFATSQKLKTYLSSEVLNQCAGVAQGIYKSRK